MIATLVVEGILALHDGGSLAHRMNIHILSFHGKDIRQPALSELGENMSYLRREGGSEHSTSLQYTVHLTYELFSDQPCLPMPRGRLHKSVWQTCLLYTSPCAAIPTPG